MSTYCFALWVSDCLIHTDDKTGSLHSTTDRVDFDEAWLPNERLHVVPDAFRAINIDTKPSFAVGVFHTKLVQNIGGVEASVITDLARDNFECLSEGDLHELQLSWDGECMLPDVSREFHL